MIKYLVLLVISAVITLMLGNRILAIPYDTYKDTLATLLTISSILFAIIGAWIAIIYPKAIQNVFKDTALDNSVIEESRADANYLGDLVEIVLVSATVLMFVLAFQFIAPLARSLDFGIDFNFFKYSTFFIVLLFTLAQLYAIIKIILTNYFFLNKLRKKNLDDEFDRLHR